MADPLEQYLPRWAIPPDAPARWPVPPVAPASDMTTPRDLREAILKKVKEEEAERERLRTTGEASPAYGGFRAPGGFYTEPTSEFSTPRDLRLAQTNAAFGWDTTNPAAEFASRLDDVAPLAVGAMPAARFTQAALTRGPEWIREALRVMYHPASNIPSVGALYSAFPIVHDITRGSNALAYWRYKHGKP